MNKKAQDFNAAYAGLALLGGIIAFYMAGRMEAGVVMKSIIGIIGVVIVYFYLVLTE